jgi:hypothetical protein
MEGLTRLHILDGEAHKRVVVHGIPQIVKARTKFKLALPLISEGVVGVDRCEIISNG